jgi:hypothetical protein
VCRLLFLSLLFPMLFFFGRQVLPGLGGLERKAFLTWAPATTTLETLANEGFYEPATKDDICITRAGDPVGIALLAFESTALGCVALGSVCLNAGWVSGVRIGWGRVMELVNGVDRQR